MNTIQAKNFSGILSNLTQHTVQVNPNVESSEFKPDKAKRAPHSIKLSTTTATRKAGKANPKHVELPDLTYRHIARMLVQALPVEGDDMTNLVNEYTDVIKNLPASARYALRAAYIFGSKAPREEREDLFQELALKALQARADSERLAYAIARADWVDWWKAYKNKAGFSTASLESTTMDGEGNEVSLGSMLVGECDFELKMDGALDAERIFDALPDNLQRIVERRLSGQMVSPFEHLELTDWAAKHAMMLA